MLIQECSKHEDSCQDTDSEPPLGALYSQALADSPNIQGHTTSSNYSRERQMPLDVGITKIMHCCVDVRTANQNNFKKNRLNK